MSSMLPWSYSGLSQFVTCPKQFYEIRVRKSVPYVSTPATEYGIALHSAAELYIKSNAPLPDEFTFIQPYLDRLLDLHGKKYTELKLAMKIENREFVACDYWDSKVWYRSIADLIITDTDRERAFLVDYKTGKSSQYADTKQMALLAALIFLHFPRVKKVKSMLLFVKCGQIVKSEYTFDDRFKVFAQVNPDLKRLKAAYDSNVWNPTKNNFCARWCAVTSCVHNGNYSE
jgi:hypothetical protein